MEFFMNPEVTLGTKVLEVFYVVMGLMAIYAGVRNLRDTTNTSRVGTFVFWCALGVLLAIGRWIPTLAAGVIVAIMIIPAMLGLVRKGTASAESAPTAEESEANFAHLGMRVFVPALCIGAFAIAGALTPGFGALPGCCTGVVVAAVLLWALSHRNTPVVFLNDSERMLSTLGGLCILPMLLAGLGAIFTSVGVGQVIAQIIGGVIPQGNVVVGVIVFAVSMMLFTMIMGNAFAAISVLTVGIGVPFVLAFGGDPATIGVLALTCGYCGTLCTPMAANFNIVPVALLEIRDRMGVIKSQIAIALIMLVVQIGFMLASL